MQYFPWNERCQIFKGTLDRVVSVLEFRTCHELITIARILENKAEFLRYEAAELLSKSTEVQSEEKALGRSAPLIDNGRGRLSSIAHE